MPSQTWIKNNPKKYVIWKQNLAKSRRFYIKNNPDFQSGMKNPMYGKTPWNRGLTQKSDPRIEKHVKTIRRRYKEGTIKPVWLGKKHTKYHRIKNSLAKLGKNNPMKRKEVRNKVSKTLKQRWKNDKEFVNTMLNSFKHLKKNNLERDFIRTCKKYNLPFIYTGDGTFWIGPCNSGKRRNPDFKHTEKKKIILLNGEHWHTKEDIDEQIKDYNKKGYNVLSIWEREWINQKNEIIKKVKEFTY